MDLFEVGFDDLFTLRISFNWGLTIVLFLLVALISFVLKKLVRHLNKKSICIDEVKLGIGSTQITIHYNRKDREIAYQIWIELITRKIGIMFDEENDVISEIYGSWYECFKTIRELLKQIPVERFSTSSALIEITTNVLNMGLRPHLTKWQARYKKWSLGNDEKIGDPQLIQRQYPEYEDLIKELKATNEKLIEYAEIVKKIAFSE